MIEASKLNETFENLSVKCTTKLLLDSYFQEERLPWECRFRDRYQGVAKVCNMLVTTSLRFKFFVAEMARVGCFGLFHLLFHQFLFHQKCLVIIIILRRICTFLQNKKKLEIVVNRYILKKILNFFLPRFGGLLFDYCEIGFLPQKKEAKIFLGSIYAH